MACVDDDSNYLNKPKLAVLPSRSHSSKTFVIEHEDHTLGNALRYVLMRDNNTEFCGYTVPHPMETAINVRLQTKEGTAAEDVLNEGLKTLSDICDHITVSFEEAVPVASGA
jgi:DNA-directed RNA polymerase I and III subunit RPAC2